MRVLVSEIAVSNPAQGMRAIGCVMLHVVLNVSANNTRVAPNITLDIRLPTRPRIVLR